MPDARAHFYFAYGSNLHPLRMTERLGAPQLLGRFALAGWARVFDKRGRDGSGKATLVPADAVVHGALYALTAADKRRLDGIEGLGTGYDEMELEFPGFGSASAYVARTDARASGLTPFDWYLGLVLAGARYLRFPASELAELAALPCVPDPDPARAAVHGRLLAACAVHPPFECISSAQPSK